MLGVAPKNGGTRTWPGGPRAVACRVKQYKHRRIITDDPSLFLGSTP